MRFQIGYCGSTMERGDVFVSNHPSAGGSHLPDITVITPVFTESADIPVFFVANRGHHADIGGITPGKHGCSYVHAWSDADSMAGDFCVLFDLLKGCASGLAACLLPVL